MELLAVIIIGVALTASGIIEPKSKDSNDVVEAPQTEVTIISCMSPLVSYHH